MDVLTAVLAAGVAAGYYTIAALIVPRIHLGEATPRFITAFRVGGVAFFVGCGLTHTHIAYHAIVDDTEVGMHEAAYHLLQVFGVWLFIYGALRFLEVRVVRRKTPDEVEAERLRDRIAELSRSNEDLERFAHVVAHDLQDPLRSITGFAELLVRDVGGNLDGRPAQSLAFVKDGSRRMSHLLDGVLAYSRVAGSELKPEAVDLDAVLDDVRANLAGTIEERGADVTADPLPTVVGDRVQLTQLLQNLVANALKFGDPDRPRVHVAAATGGGVAVRDNGAGVDPRDADKIFEMFRRGRTATGRPGMGLGLALCAKIVERHGGRLWHEPAPEGGSVFRFTLLEQRAPDREAPAARAA